MAIMDLDAVRLELPTYEAPLAELEKSLDVENKKRRVEELNLLMQEPGFWDDTEKAQGLMQELNSKKADIEICEKLLTQFNDFPDLIAMANDENDEGMAADIRAEYEDFKNTFEEVKLKTMLSGEYDKDNATLSLNSGAGGTESCDWASMLYRMYTRWAEKKGFKVDVLDLQEGDEAGIKSATIQINGENAYGYLKSEHGVHRLVRISPFNAQGKRQTSFVGVEVMPVLDDEVGDIEVRDEDIRIDTYRSSGAGGQHINKTSSAIRITHFPTGIVVTCQNERSQFQNKDKAMQMLKSKLKFLQEQENMAKAEGIKGEQMENGWGSQIRNYVLQPYTMVKDTRTGCEVAQADAVLDGKLDPFINAYLRWINLGEKDA